MCHRALHRCFSVFDVVPDKYKTQEICNLAVSLYFPFIVYCPYKYITQEMCDKAVNDSPAALKHIPIWFVKVKLLKLFTALYADEELMSAVWHPTRWWDWCVSEDEKMKIDPIFMKEL